uniref:L,D-transpeptidase n=2 Tax=Cyanobium sp. TaxID=2164130 RepID=UPI004047D48D
MKAWLGAGIAISQLASPALAWLPAAEQAAQAEAAQAQQSQRVLVLDRRRRQLVVLDDGLEVRRFSVGVGKPGWETPVGHFQVIELVVDPIWVHPATGQAIPPGADNPLGSRWIGFYRDCKSRKGFNGNANLTTHGCVTAGFHGTPNRASVGRAVSHGCVRLLDEQAQDLFGLVQLGTPVTVLP